MVVCPGWQADLGSVQPATCPHCAYSFPPILLPTGSGFVTATSPAALPSYRSCPNCRAPMDASRTLSFRVGGYTEGPRFFLGNWNQSAEDLQPFAIYHCKSCGKVEFWKPGR